MHRRIEVIVLVCMFGVGVGLFFPFVFRAQVENMRKATSTHNLKQMGEALDGYQTTHGNLPPAAMPGTGLPFEKRLSWLVALLPYLQRDDFGESPRRVYILMNRSKAWDAAENLPNTRTVFRRFLCLGNPDRVPLDSPGLTEYVGFTGIGADILRPDKPGAFGLGRGARVPLDFPDGTSNTGIVAETALDNGPWAAAGSATVRGLDTNRQPYVGWGRQFGGIYSPNTEVLMADGAVRTLLDSMSPGTVERLINLADGEIISSDW
jgi:hypothetical protein